MVNETNCTLATAIGIHLLSLSPPRFHSPASTSIGQCYLPGEDI